MHKSLVKQKMRTARKARHVEPHTALSSHVQPQQHHHKQQAQAQAQHQHQL